MRRRKRIVPYAEEADDAANKVSQRNRKVLNVREYVLDYYIKIIRNFIPAAYNTHMSGKKQLQIKFRKRNYAFLQKRTIATWKIGASDILLKNYIAAKQDFPVWPVKPDRAGGMAGGKNCLECLVSQIDFAIIQWQIDLHLRHGNTE